MRNGILLYARIFPNGDDALVWAAGERKELLVKVGEPSEPTRTPPYSSAV
jgi:hypothetical protein